MLKTESKFHRLLLMFLILFSCSIYTSGQKPVKCKVERKKNPNHKIVDWYRGESKLASIKPTLFMKAVIKPEDVNAENLIALAHHFKQTYCRENRFIIQIFDNKKASQTDPLEDIVKGTPRATYLFDREKGEESLETYVVKNGRQVGSEIKLRG